MKKRLCVAAAAGALLALSACKKEKTVTLVMAEVNPADSLSAQMDKAFAEQVASLSDGALVIDLHTDGTLGDNTAVLAMMTQPKSAIHLARVSPAAVQKYGCDQHGMLEAPFTFVSHAHFWAFTRSDAAATILDDPYKSGVGIKGLFFAEEGFRHFFSTKPLLRLEDFAGEKIRTAGGESMTGIITALKAVPVSVTFSELYAAMSTGVADVAEQPIANYLSNHFNKIAPYMLLDGHSLGITEVVITAEAWDSLSARQQHILLEASQYAAGYCNEIAQATEARARQMLEAEGAQFIEVDDVGAWQRACAGVIQDAVKGNRDVYQQIQALAEPR